MITFLAFALSCPLVSASDDEVAWGLLVDLWATEPTTGAPALVARDLPVGPGLHPDASVSVSPVSGLVHLTLPHAVGSRALDGAIAVLDAGLIPIDDGGAVPRDAALVMRAPRGAIVELGEVQPRILRHPLEADRLVIDPAVSSLDSARAGGSVAPDGRGLPVGRDVVLALSADGRRATRNLRGAPSASPLAGGVSGAPEVLGTFQVAMPKIAGQPGGSFLIDVAWKAKSCAKTPEMGDLLRTAGGQHTFGVSAPGPAPVQGKSIAIQCILIAGDPATVPGASRGWHGSIWNLAAGDDPACYLRTFPAPGAEPNEDVDPSALVAVRFTEPMDAATAEAYDAVAVSRKASGASPLDLVAGEVSLGGDGSVVYFVPHQPYPHLAGLAEKLYVTVTDALEDLDGIGVQRAPQLWFALDPAAASTGSASVVLHFDGPDEDANGFPELRGQFVLDPATQSISGRPVTRFSRAADSSQAVPSLMTPYPPGVKNPLNPLGSRSMSLYRYLDMGLSVADEQSYNLDVERLHWAPAGGQVVFDHYPQFEIALGHSHYLPDEVANPASLLPSYPTSGLYGGEFDKNLLVGTQSQVVHPRSLGYTINPLDGFLGVSGKALMPYPLNTGGDASKYEYYTWRDTSIDALAGPNGPGLEPQIAVNAGLAASSGELAAGGFVPTHGLPLLMDFRCFPSSSALGLNSLDISMAINSSSKPHFRAFSGGGIDASGQVVAVDPDLAKVPSGGFNPNSTPPGAKTKPTDNVFFNGQVDFVVRVSRAHTIWIDSESASPDWLLADLDADLPPGTTLIAEYRGAVSVGPTSAGSPAEDAGVLDAYGDQPGTFGIAGDPSQENQSIVFLDGDDGWKGSIDAVDGARYIQVRLTFTADAASGLVPRLEALGLSFTR